MIRRAVANVKRHAYLPFGEELFAPTGGRTTAQGYSVGDGVRQKFTLKERDVETDLDYFGARYYGGLQGRFTSVDPLMASVRPGNPQTFNRYSYTLNNPLRYVDLTGLVEQDPVSSRVIDCCRSPLGAFDNKLEGHSTKATTVLTNPSQHEQFRTAYETLISRQELGVLPPIAAVL